MLVSLTKPSDPRVAVKGATKHFDLAKSVCVSPDAVGVSRGYRRCQPRNPLGVSPESPR